MDASNVLGTFYANPYYQGRAGAQTGQGPGGFGSPLYGTTGASGSPGTGFGGTSIGRSSTSGGGTGFGGTTTTSRTGTAGVGGTTGRAGGGTAGFGGTGFSAGGIGGGSTGLGRTGSTGVTSNAVGGVLASSPRAVTYQTRLSFTPPPVTAPQMQANLQGLLARSSMIGNPAGVEVAADAAGLVVLRGAVRTEDEARLAEGMIRLTPGVRGVRNELSYPRP